MTTMDNIIGVDIFPHNLAGQRIITVSVPHDADDIQHTVDVDLLEALRAGKAPHHIYKYVRWDIYYPNVIAGSKSWKTDSPLKLLAFDGVLADRRPDLLEEGDA